MTGHLEQHAAVVWTGVTGGQAGIGPTSWRKDSEGRFSDEPCLGGAALARITPALPRKEMKMGSLSNLEFLNS